LYTIIKRCFNSTSYRFLFILDYMTIPYVSLIINCYYSSFFVSTYMTSYCYCYCN